MRTNTDVEVVVDKRTIYPHGRRARTVYDASMGSHTVTGTTPKIAREALLADLLAKAESPYVAAWAKDGTVFMVRACGDGCWGYSIIARGREGSVDTFTSCMGAKTRQQAIEDAKRHAESYCE